MSSLRSTALLTALSVLAQPAGLSAQDRVAQTVHNLSASGPGVVRAVSEQQVCIFCHAPHNTSGVRPLWNRELPLGSYRIYESSTLDADPQQPTGASKLCLSCHDGTIALGSVLSRGDQIRMMGGDFRPAGLTNLGTDLSDDHPISFFYTSGLAASDRQLVDPQSLPMQVRLDEDGQLQCTACHDPHNNSHGQFLVLSEAFGVLCAACHRMEGWPASAHEMSAASVAGAATTPWPFATVAENACRSCHRSHTAGGRHRLLIHELEEDNCLNCHNGQIARTNLVAQIDKLSGHDPRRYAGVHDPMEALSGQSAHVECADCHNPHAATAPSPAAGYVPLGNTLRNVTGVTTGGATVRNAQYEYEVCFKCHTDAAVDVRRRLSRQSQTANLRLKLSVGNPSFHPVVGSSPSPDTVSLVPSLSSGGLVRCTDCHNNDTGPRDGGGGPDGPHGSGFDFLLARNYTVTDGTPESAFEYALCYKCHERASILGDESFREHRLHVVEERTPCSACHDPHGVSLTQATGSDHSHLINFDTLIVRPDPGSGRLEFRDLGTFAGSCTLTCHGEVHRDLEYRR